MEHMQKKKPIFLLEVQLPVICSDLSLNERSIPVI